MKTSLIALLTFLVCLGNALQAQNQTVKEAWVKKFASSLAPKFDEATAIAVDDSGNVYVTGSSSGQLSNPDYLTVKYNREGIQAWTARFNGENNDEDFPSAISVDALGNIYVTGKSIGFGSSFDYLTIKYNSAGIQEWVVRYNSPANSNDEAAAMTLDHLGNVYVTGKSEGAGASFDYATVKYNHAGIQQWVARYNGPGNLIDAAAAVAVALDSTGENEIYVTGASQVAVGSYEYATIKYNSAGIQQWIARYHGKENSENRSVALAVDGKSNVYVTGWSTGSSAGLDYATVKYDMAGNERWVTRYNGQGNANDKPAAIATDKAGNIYVTGSEQSARPSRDRDYATVKYNNEGVEQWVARFNGTVDWHDEAVGLAVDATGNIYVGGYSPGFNVLTDYVTIKYNSAGIPQWTAGYNSNSEKYDDIAVALAINNVGEVFVTGSSRNYGADIDFDFTTVKYGNNGARLWDVHYNSAGNFKDEAVDVIADEAGNVYVTGWSLASNSSRDYATIKYNSSGEMQWLARYNGPGNSFDEPVAIAIDGTGDVYVTGRSVSAAANFKYNYDFATVKYDHNGKEQWVARYGASENSADVAAALALDGAGNVYVAGSSDQNPITIKYNNTGVQQWVAQYNGLGDAIALALDASENIYVLSRFQLLIKYSNIGVQLWARKGPSNAVGLAVDDSGNVYATGWFELQHGYSYGITQKFNRAGDQQWEARYEPEPYSDNVATAIGADVAGNVYVTGFSSVDYATIKYNHVGVRQWIARYKGPGNFFYNPADLALDSQGNVYIAASNNGDYVTVKYNANGVQQWVARYSDTQNTSDSPRALFVDKAGNVYVTGTSEYRQMSSIRYESIYTTIKYTQATPVSVHENETGIPQDYSLSQNYPNPFNPSTTIRYALPKSEYVTLKVFDLMGKEAATLVRGKKAAGEYQVHWDASDLPGGLYIYRLQAGEYAANKKLVLLK